MIIPDGWSEYQFNRPPNVLCKFCRDGGIQFVCKPSELHPESNVVGLFWQLTGIGRMQVDSMSPEAKAQLEASSGCLGASLTNALFGSAAMGVITGYSDHSRTDRLSSAIGATLLDIKARERGW